VPGNAATNGQTLADASTYLAQNYAQYAKTPTVVRNAIKTSGMDLTLDQATNRISASQVGDLGFVEVKATGPNRADAERLTRFAAASLISTIQAQQTEAKFADLQPIQTARDSAQTQLNALPPAARTGPRSRARSTRTTSPRSTSGAARTTTSSRSRGPSPATARSPRCRCATPSWRSSSRWSS
jgi:hypothetical protein